METPHVSHSQLNMWLRCPRQWMYRYVLNISLPPSGAQMQGGSYHKALSVNFHQKIRSGLDLPVDDWLDAFSTDWQKSIEQEDSIEWEDEDPGKLKDEGVKLVKAYAETTASSVYPLEVEKPLTKEFAGTILLGIPDIEDENFIIIDHKTSARMYAQDTVDRDIQLSAYGFLKGHPISGEVHVAVKPTKTLPARIQVVKTERSKERILWWAKMAEQIVQAMRSGIAYPSPFDYYCSARFCGYFEICKQELSTKYSI